MKQRLAPWRARLRPFGLTSKPNAEPRVFPAPPPQQKTLEASDPSPFDKRLESMRHTTHRVVGVLLYALLMPWVWIFNLAIAFLDSFLMRSFFAMMRVSFTIWDIFSHKKGQHYYQAHNAQLDRAEQQHVPSHENPVRRFFRKHMKRSDDIEFMLSIPFGGIDKEELDTLELNTSKGVGSVFLSLFGSEFCYATKRSDWAVFAFFVFFSTSYTWFFSKAIDFVSMLLSVPETLGWDASFILLFSVAFMIAARKSSFDADFYTSPFQMIKKDIRHTLLQDDIDQHPLILHRDVDGAPYVYCPIHWYLGLPAVTAQSERHHVDAKPTRPCGSFRRLALLGLYIMGFERVYLRKMPLYILARYDADSVQQLEGKTLWRLMPGRSPQTHPIAAVQYFIHHLTDINPSLIECTSHAWEGRETTSQAVLQGQAIAVPWGFVSLPTTSDVLKGRLLQPSRIDFQALSSGRFSISSPYHLDAQAIRMRVNAAKIWSSSQPDAVVTMALARCALLSGHRTNLLNNKRPDFIRAVAHHAGWRDEDLAEASAASAQEDGQDWEPLASKGGVDAFWLMKIQVLFHFMRLGLLAARLNLHVRDDGILCYQGNPVKNMTHLDSNDHFDLGSSQVDFQRALMDRFDLAPSGLRLCVTCATEGGECTHSVLLASVPKTIALSMDPFSFALMHFFSDALAQPQGSEVTYFGAFLTPDSSVDVCMPTEVFSLDQKTYFNWHVFFHVMASSESIQAFTDELFGPIPDAVDQASAASSTSSTSRALIHHPGVFKNNALLDAFASDIPLDRSALTFEQPIDRHEAWDAVKQSFFDDHQKSFQPDGLASSAAAEGFLPQYNQDIKAHIDALSQCMLHAQDPISFCYFAKVKARYFKLHVKDLHHWMESESEAFLNCFFEGVCQDASHACVDLIRAQHLALLQCLVDHRPSFVNEWIGSRLLSGSALSPAKQIFYQVACQVYRQYPAGERRQSIGHVHAHCMDAQTLDFNYPEVARIFSSGQEHDRAEVLADYLAKFTAQMCGDHDAIQSLFVLQRHDDLASADTVCFPALIDVFREIAACCNHSEASRSLVQPAVQSLLQVSEIVSGKPWGDLLKAYLFDNQECLNKRPAADTGRQNKRLSFMRQKTNTTYEFILKHFPDLSLSAQAHSSKPQRRARLLSTASTQPTVPQGLGGGGAGAESSQSNQTGGQFDYAGL